MTAYYVSRRRGTCETHRVPELKVIQQVACGPAGNGNGAIRQDSRFDHGLDHFLSEPRG
jgi:hypothetical protein